MKKLSDVVITFDYELFLGVDSGTAEKCIIKPVNYILEEFEKYNGKGIFFVDATYLLTLKKFQHPDFKIISQQIQEIVKRGNNVELHIHPHWLDASPLDNKRWTFVNFDKYRLHSLTKIDKTVDWELFRPTLEQARKKERKSNAGAKGFDVIMLFKILILQSLYNLSDEAMEYQILDRYSFSRFLGLYAASKIPDATTIWRFREDLIKANAVETLFIQFEQFLHKQGIRAQKGQIIDASIVRTPIQRNSRDENKQVKEGKRPEGWNNHKQSQKDIDARWTEKNGRNFFGYKNHISVDVKYKLIRRFQVSSAEVHDTHVFEDLLDHDNTSRDVWADSAYRSQKRVEYLKETGYREHLQRRGVVTGNSVDGSNRATGPGLKYDPGLNMYLVYRLKKPPA